MASNSTLHKLRTCADKFYRSPTKCLVELGISRKTLFLDLLQALCLDDTGEDLKLKILLLLQENPCVLLEDAASAVGSLKDMFLNPSGTLSPFYQSQLLLTMTVVSIATEIIESSPEVFAGVMELLLDVISRINTANILVRKMAAECLWEVEVSYPGLLQGKIEHFYTMASKENSSIFQSYLVLFVSVLKHIIQQMAKSTKIPSTGFLNDLLTSRSEPLKPLLLPEVYTADCFPVAGYEGSCVGDPASFVDESVDKRDLKRAVSYVMENATLLSSPCLAYIMRQLMECVNLTNLSPTTFKTQFLHCISTMDLPLFHMLLLLKLKFSHSMFDEYDELLLLQRLIILLNDPTLPYQQRLLCYEYLMHFPDEQDKSGRAPVKPCAPRCLDNAQILYFFPVIFDSLDVIQRKLRMLSLCFVPGDTPDNACSFLINSLKILHKVVSRGISGGHAVVLFRSLFVFFCDHSHSALVDQIYRFILSIVVDNPQFVPHAVDFVEGVAHGAPESRVPAELLRLLTDHIVSLPTIIVLHHLPYYLRVLERAAKETSISPKGIIKFLHQLLDNTDICHQGKWATGNRFLSVCLSILQCHNTENGFAEFGDLLMLISHRYKDIDIRDKARFYYALLVNVSSEKCTKILSAESSTRRKTADEVGTTSFPTALPVTVITNPFLRLTRIPDSATGEPTASQIPETTEVSEQAPVLQLDKSDFLTMYKDIINDTSFIPVVGIKYYLHFDEGNHQSNRRKVYALMLQFKTDSNYQPLRDIHVPYLSWKKSGQPQEGCHQVNLDFLPKEPVPARFSVRAIFSDEMGQTCTMELEPITVDFVDLFLPIPFSKLSDKLGSSAREEGAAMWNSEEIKRELFTELWDDIVHHLYTKKTPQCSGAQSVKCLDVWFPDVSSQLTQAHKQFIISQTAELAELGVFLPPSYHLLLKFVPSQGMTVVTMATDNWRVFALVDKFLQRFGDGQ